MRLAEETIIQAWAKRHAEYERRCHFYGVVENRAPFALVFLLLFGIVFRSPWAWLAFYLLGLLYWISIRICVRLAKEFALCPCCGKPPFLDDEGRVVADSNPEFCCHCGVRLNPPGLAE